MTGVSLTGDAGEAGGAGEAVEARAAERSFADGGSGEGVAGER